MISKYVSLAIAVGAASFAMTASADTFVAGCVPMDTGYNMNLGGEIQVLTGSSSSTCSTLAYYYAATSMPAGCTSLNRSQDVLKVWLSLAQAAVLSGKKLNLSYVPCGGFNYITSMQLERQ
jgi:hypothetical protein